MKIHIQADLTKPQSKYLHITYTITELEHKELTMVFPVWTPGSYLLREFSMNVEAFSAEVSGKKLPHQKISKNEWTIRVGSNRSVKVHYKLYAHDLSVRGVYLNSDMCFWNGTSAFFYPKDHLDLPVTLSIKTPAKWSIHLAKSAKSSKYYFSNFDELFDTPVLAAKEVQVLKFKEQNTRFELALWGRHNGDEKQLVKDMQAIIKKQIQVFGEHPCSKYLFIVMFAPGQFGGLEHMESSANLFDGLKLAESKNYQRFLSLLSHEHFHLWNVKRIRPKGLGPFDYTKEVYTRDLWIAEGITSYYDDHFVYRAGGYTQKEYLDLVAANITRLEISKNSKVNSISDSSFDAWIKFYRQNENSLNTVVSYYLKGGLVMMLLDFYILQKTKGKKSLDDVMKLLYQNYLKNPDEGLTREEFFAAVHKVSGFDGKSFVKDYLDGTKSVAWAKEFKNFGIELKQKRDSKKNFLGVVLKKSGSQVLIHSIAEDSPAFESDLQPGDEIVALNGLRVLKPSDLDDHLKDSQLEVVYSRFQELGTCSVNLNQKSPAKAVLEVQATRAAKSKQLRDRFLRKS